MKVRAVVGAFGLDLSRTRGALRGFPRYWSDRRLYKKSRPGGRFQATLRDAYPVLHEFESEAGSARGHYFHQDLWAARLIYDRRPDSHLDIGSRIDGFVAHLLTFMPVTVIDVRWLENDVAGLSFVQGDATDLREIREASVISLSSLHAVEHFGLGRYGDPVDPEAPLKALREMERILAPGGHLYLGVPIGRERLEFNAHRVFSSFTILESFSRLDLVSFALVDDAGNLHSPAEPSSVTTAEYSCGLFDFTKRTMGDSAQEFSVGDPLDP